MTGYDLYVLVLCLVMFVLTLLLFGLMLGIIMVQKLRAIAGGLHDKDIVKEYRNYHGDRSCHKCAYSVISFILALVLLAFMGGVISMQFTDTKMQGDYILPRVVLSDSMSYQRETNTYLKENNLNNQFDTFDLIFTHALPDEFELEVYDIVVYEVEGDLIIHRIVSIEEPTAEHPDHRYFELRGDAVRTSDKKPVLYEQMRAIYKGQKIPFVGSFVHFMQSPVGYICVLLVIFGFIVAPILDGIVWKKKVIRYHEIAEYGFYED